MVYKRIRDLREDNDYNQTFIGKIVHISQKRYSDFENGRSSIPADILIGLAKFYNTSVDYLLDLTDAEIPYPRKK